MMGDAATLNNISALKERNVKELKRHVEGWREVIIICQSVLIWEQHWYPALIFGSSTFVFLLFWYMDPSLLTAVSILCLIVTLLDSLVPILTMNICDPAGWTGNKERQLEEFCRTVVDYKCIVKSQWIYFQNMKLVKPKLYYGIVVASLLFLAWIGNWNNLVLTYLFVTILLMVPGLVHHGFLQKYYTASLLAIASLLKTMTGDKVKTK